MAENYFKLDEMSTDNILAGAESSAADNGMTDAFGGAKTGNTIHYAFLDKSFTCFDNYNSDWLATNSLQKLFRLEKFKHLKKGKNRIFEKKKIGSAIYKFRQKCQEEDAKGKSGEFMWCFCSLQNV